MNDRVLKKQFACSDIFKVGNKVSIFSADCSIFLLYSSRQKKMLKDEQVARVSQQLCDRKCPGEKNRLSVNAVEKNREDNEFNQEQYDHWQICDEKYELSGHFGHGDKRGYLSQEKVGKSIGSKGFYGLGDHGEMNELNLHLKNLEMRLEMEAKQRVTMELRLKELEKENSNLKDEIFLLKNRVKVIYQFTPFNVFKAHRFLKFVRPYSSMPYRRWGGGLE